MIQDFTLQMTPSKARRLLRIARGGKLTVSDSIREMAKQDMLTMHDILPYLANPSQCDLDVVQQLIDYDLRAIVPWSLANQRRCLVAAILLKAHPIFVPYADLSIVDDSLYSNQPSRLEEEARLQIFDLPVANSEFNKLREGTAFGVLSGDISCCAIRHRIIAIGVCSSLTATMSEAVEAASSLYANGPQFRINNSGLENTDIFTTRGYTNVSFDLVMEMISAISVT